MALLVVAFAAVAWANVTFSGTTGPDVVDLGQMLYEAHLGEMVAAEPYTPQLPLSFIPNHGQTDPSVRFHVKGPGHTIFFADDEVVFSAGQVAADGETATDVVRMAFVGANPSPTLETMGALPGVVNFYIGSQPSDWQNNVPTYGAVAYRDLYPGIDLVYRGSEGRLKSEFIVAPGSDPGSIRLAYTGVMAMSIRVDGALVLQTDMGELIETAPFLYQQINGHRREVAGSYLLLDAAQVGFSIGAYDMAYPLVIDPTLVYSTYIGGSRLDSPTDLAVDSSGSAYVTGGTSSNDFPTVNAALDAFVTKLNPTGSAVVYSTYLGGGGRSDGGSEIAVDSSGNAYVTGATWSFDFPTTPGAYQTIKTGSLNEVFVTKLDGSGAMVYSTYIGGRGGEYGDGIAVDASGSAYVTGPTNSSDYPSTPGAFQTVNRRGVHDAFVTKLDPTGSSLVYSTFLGGTRQEGGRGIAVDGAGNVYVTGNTSSGNFPTVNPIQATLNPGGNLPGYGPVDLFIAKLNPAGSALIYSTYLGGDRIEFSYSLTIDSSGNTYVTGITASSNFPTVNAIQPVHGGGSFVPNWGGPFDGFVVKVNAAGSALAYSTYLGGSGSDNTLGSVVDGTGSLYVTGRTDSTDFPPTVNAIQASLDGTSDAYVVQLNAAGSAIDFGTYLGGAGLDYGTGIGLDGSGSIYIAGGTDSSDFPTQDPIQVTVGGSRDAFIAKISFNQAPRANAGEDLIIEWTGDNVALDGTGSEDPDGDFLSFSWTQISGLKATVADADTAETTFTPPSLGTYTFTLTVTDPSGESDSDDVAITVEDTSAPVIAGVVANSKVLWPPNHKMRAVTITVDVSDACDANSNCKIVSVASNEAANGKGDGNTEPDWEITGILTLDLRAERSGQGDGRVYTLSIECTDSSDNSSTTEVTVTVPRGGR